MGKGRRPTGAAWLVVGALVVSLLVAEVGLRLLDHTRFALDPHTPFHRTSGAGLYWAHPYMSYDMKPGYDGGDVHVNALGFRGPETTEAKPAGVLRVVTLGGSTTYGISVADDETYPYHLGRELAAALGDGRVEVVNAGMVGATSAESLVRLLLRVLPLDPDVVVFYEGFNDLPPRVFDGFADDYAHFRRHPANRHPLLERSHVFRLVAGAVGYARTSGNTGLSEATWRLDNLPADDADRIANFESTTPAVYERNLEYIVQLALARDVGIVLATFPHRADRPDWNDVVPAELWGPGIGQHNDVVRGLAAAYDLPLIDYAGHAAAQDADDFADSIHLTPDGHRAQAAFFAETLAPLLDARR